MNHSLAYVARLYWLFILVASVALFIMCCVCMTMSDSTTEAVRWLCWMAWDVVIAFVAVFFYRVFKD